MNYLSGVLFCCVLTIVSNQGTFADVEDKSEEIEQEIKSQNENVTSSVESGPPDSHEAMNNRETIRDKRSYEFLMGLVKNNSKFEITKIDPSQNSHGASNSQDTDFASSAASELLLELLVKIAAHPDHWNKVHNLLERIDADLESSKKILNEMSTAQVKIEPKQPEPSSTIKKKETDRLRHLEKNEWPTFDQLESDLNNKKHNNNNNNNNIGFINTAAPAENYRFQTSHKPIYPKTFAYHRVTGRPMYLNKNPKAYIAVSVIAPKPITTRSNIINNVNNNNGKDDLSLEKELRELKPWTHNDNLKNMASIRSRWVIEGGGKKDLPVAP